MDDEIIKEFETALLTLDRLKVKTILVDQTKENDFLKSLEDIVVPAMESIGKKWEDGKVALSQVYMGGKICEEIVDELLPQTNTKRVNDPNLGLLVYKDYHMLGKQIVYTFLRASGYDVKDYGSQHNIDEIIQNIKKDNIQILLISVLMLNSALNIKELILAIKQNGLKTKVIVGGAPFRFDKGLYKEVGANATASIASGVLDVIENLRG